VRFLGKVEKILFFVITLAFSGSGLAAVTYVTHDSGGKPIAVFTQVQGPGKFGKSWKDPSGKIWSHNLGYFDNSGPTDNNFVLDSPAISACAQIGGSLPSAADFLELMSNFERDKVEVLTPQGKKDLQAIFPDLNTNGNKGAFWTASVLNNVDPHDRLGLFITGEGILDQWNLPPSVRCVQTSDRNIPGCGVSGTTSERINDCKKYYGSTVTTEQHSLWRLVSRVVGSSGKSEIWQDVSSGLVWSLSLKSKYKYDDAITVDKNNCVVEPYNQWAFNCKVITETACSSKEAETATNGITDLKFSLPTLDDLWDAKNHGMEQLPDFFGSNLMSTLWTSPGDKALGPAEFGGIGPNGIPFTYDVHVKCVGK